MTTTPDRYKRRLTIAAVALTLIAVTIVLGTMWWWALNGLTQEIGQAFGITAAMCVVAAVVALIIKNWD